MNIKELRASFWRDHPAFKRKAIGAPGTMRPASQNEYPADIRCAWVDYVDAMARGGQISDRVAQSATLS